MLDFNDAGEQRSGSGPIPPGSIVRVKMTLRPPKSGKESDLHPLMSKAQSGNSYLDTEMVITDGSFEGRKIWQNFTLSGSEKATNISVASFRAILESARGISPKDDSTQANQGRKVEGWESFEGIEFAMEVGVEPPKVGDQYINNKLHRVITPDDEGYEAVMAGGEIISDKPIPAIPQAASSPSGSGGWGGAPSSSSPPAGTTGNGGGVPSWASK